MSATPEPTQEAPEQERPSFDEAFAALPRGDAPAEDVSETGQPDERPTQAQATAPGASQAADEPDDDDEQLPYDQRFARAQRREQRITARQAEIMAERQRAIDQANGYKGNLAQEKARREAIEAERDRFKTLAENENARLNSMWEEAIKLADDPNQRADLQDRYERDRDRREIAAEKDRMAFERDQQQQQATRVKQDQIETATQGLRQHVIPSLVEPMEQFAQVLGLPATEFADIRATLNSRPMQQLFARLSPEELDAYRNELGEGIFTELAQRNLARKQRETGQNRDEARQVYRAEQPVGQGGGGSDLESLGGLDFDEAFAANARNQRRLAGERVTA